MKPGVTGKGQSRHRGRKRKTSIALAVIILIIVLFFPLILRYVLSRCPSGLLEIPRCIDSWFSFLGSYLGVVVSVIIAYVTIWLTLRLDEISRDTALRDSRMSIAVNMPNMQCKEMVLYSLDAEDHPYRELPMFEDEKDYFWSFCMTPAFPPYLAVEIDRIELQLKNFRTGGSITASAHLNTDDYMCINNTEFQAVINVPENMDEEKGMKMLYMLYLYNEAGEKYESGIVDIWLDISCSNVLLEDTDGNVDFRLHFQVRNKGKKEHGDGVRLEVINRQFERIK